MKKLFKKGSFGRSLRTAGSVGAGIGVDYATFKAVTPLAEKLFPESKGAAETAKWLGSGILSGYATTKASGLFGGRSRSRRMRAGGR